MIRQYTNMFQDSCTSAQNLLKMSGAEQWIQKTGFEARNALRASGIVSDASEADAKTRTDGAAVLDYAPTRKDSGGNVVDAPELNLTWSLLSGGSFNASYSKELKELMMTLVGTVIYVREGSGKDTVTRAIPIAGQDLVGFLFGRPDTQVLESEAFRLRCVEEDGDDRCLTVKKTTLDEVNLPYEFMKAASNYRNSILRRDPNLVSEADMLLLASSSTIPLIRLINATASHRYLGFSQDIMRIYVEAAASASSASQTGVIAAEHLKVIEARIDEVRKDIASRSDAVFQQMGRAHSFITQIEHLERSVKGALAADLAANLSFGENL